MRIDKWKAYFISIEVNLHKISIELRLLVLCCVVILYFQNLAGQSLPYNHLFDDSKLSSVYILMSPDSLDDMYENYESGHEYLATFIFDDGTTQDTVDEIGIRFRGNTSLSSAKKSFKISFNTYHAGREYSAVQKLNLTGSHNDPSMVREKLYFDIYNDFGLPVRRTNFVKLFINGDYYGLYTNLEEMDEIFLKDRFGDASGNMFKCIWGSDLTYHGAAQSYYENSSYELQTNAQQNDYTDLIHFIDVLNNTSDADFQCEIEKVFNVQNFLKIYALDISSGHWDNYGANNNNFFLYHNPFTGQFEFLSYDTDNTFGVDWFGIDWTDRNIYNWQFDDRPLVDRIMNVPAYKDQLSFYLNELIQSILLPENIYAQIDGYRDLIDTAALDDEWRTYDYGYTYNDFFNSFNTNNIDDHTPFGIKNFIQARYDNSNDQLEMNDIFPVVQLVSHEPLVPASDDAMQLRIKCLDDNLIASVKLFYNLNAGSFNEVLLYDDGAHNDSLANDLVFGNSISSTTMDGILNYYLEITDNASHITRYPFCDEFSLIVGYHPPGLVINEFMAKNITTIQDNANEFEDYIEIYNKSDASVYLGDKFLSDEFDHPSKWQMPDQYLAADGYLLVWADDAWEQGAMHCSFKLDGDKDEIYIFDNAGTYFSLIDSISFNSQTDDISMGRLPNGTGTFTILPVASPGSNNESTVNPPETSNENQLVIFSNPSYQILNFNILIASLSAQTNVDLLNIEGQDILKIEDDYLVTGSYGFSINTSNFARGIYYLRAVFDQSVKIYRVVIF